MGAGQNVVANLCLKTGATSSPTTRARVSVPEQRNRVVQCILKFAVLLVTVTLAVLVVWITTRNERVQSSPFRRPPHIVFILADDLGWADLSYNGNPQIRTPNIDALAWNGVRLTRLYHQPLCTPSRAAIMTGRYPIHTGMQHFVIKAAEPRGLPLNLKLLPEWLNDLGYSSYMVGKWHLGFHKTEYTPTRRGFLSHVGSWSGACEYTTHEWATLGTTDYGLDFRRNLTLAPEDSGRYYTEIVTEEAVSLIKNHPVEKPMFLYVAHLAPHYGSIRVKLEAPAEYLEGYDFIGVRNREIYAGGEVSKLGEIDGVSHLRSLDDPLAYPPRNEVLLNIDPIEGNEAIIHDSHKLVYGAFPSGTSQWLDVPGSRLPTAEETDLAHESCIKGMSYKILKTAGFSPNCGEGGGVYSTPVNCGNRNTSKVPCDSRVAPCLYNVNIDPCEYYNIANENPQIVLKLQARISEYKKGALKPSNLPNDPSSSPHNHDGAWVSWKDGSA